MALTLEVCTLEEKCASLERSKEDLLELRDKFREWLKSQPHLPQGFISISNHYFLLRGSVTFNICIF